MQNERFMRNGSIRGYLVLFVMILIWNQHHKRAE